jgi:Na+-driven multidrug efflux pump
VWIAGFYNMIFLGSVGLLFEIFAGPIVSVFTHNPAVQPIALNCLRIVRYGNLNYAYVMLLTQSFNGAGDTWTPTILNLVCFWLLEIPLAYVLAYRLGMGPRGGFVAITTAFSSIAVASALIFRQGKWKARKV